MLKQRVLTAAIIAPLILAALFMLPPLGFAVVAGVIIAIGALEWAPLMGWTTNIGKTIYTLIIMAAVSLTAAFTLDHQMTGLTNPMLAEAILWLSLLWWVSSVALILTYPKSSGIWTEGVATRGVFGILALVPTWLAFVLLRSIDYDTQPMFGAMVVCYVFGIVWSTDIGAYFVGKSIGKNKLMPKVSPGKTIEGLAGGLVCSVVFAVIVAQLMDFDAAFSTKLVAITFGVALLSAFGDLAESMLKREAGVKDSGRILPGHGGVLDRIDSLLAALPLFALAYLAWLR